MNKTFSQSITTGQQNVYYDEVLDFGVHRLQIHIDSDSYDFQCKAYVSRWNGEEWKTVHTIPHGAMKTPKGLCYKSVITHQRGDDSQSNSLPLTKPFLDFFQEDRDELIRVATGIII